MELDADMSLHVLDSKDQKPTLGSCLMTLHCHRCSTVLGDSLAVCGDFKMTDSIMIVRVTDSVSLSDKTGSTKDRGLKNCLHRALECSRCQCIIGAVVDSTPVHFEILRSVFLLHKENINCYIFEQSKMVKALDVVFDLKPISESITEAIKAFRAQSDHMSVLHDSLCELGSL
ncbi:protein Mis18-beta [Gadus morhua]|uniref:protein Mis18-beta n=1 Tax=Gadus morhua TaxID=8049 RepID=UPI0011B3FAF7|nr:protein Mis18-beta-like [Gadus morhua]